MHVKEKGRNLDAEVLSFVRSEGVDVRQDDWGCTVKSKVPGLSADSNVGF